MDVIRTVAQDALEATQRPGGFGVPVERGGRDGTLASIEGSSTQIQKMFIAGVFLA